VVRAKIILAAADGRMNKDIAREPGTTPHAVARWRNRFVEGGLDAITRNQTRTSQKPSKQQELAQKVIDTTTQVKPPNATHGSTRTLAKELGLSQSMVHRVRRRPDSSRI
jgi:transposase